MQSNCWRNPPDSPWLHALSFFWCWPEFLINTFWPASAYLWISPPHFGGSVWESACVCVKLITGKYCHLLTLTGSVIILWSKLTNRESPAGNWLTGCYSQQRRSQIQLDWLIYTSSLKYSPVYNNAVNHSNIKYTLKMWHHVAYMLNIPFGTC